MSWLVLICAGFFEVAGVLGMTWIGQRKDYRDGSLYVLALISLAC